MQAHDQNRTFQTGAVRDGGKKPCLQYISPHAMFRLGEWLRFACQDRKPTPYPPRNWEKGMPMSECVASLQRHIEKFKLGDKSEDHVAAILFNGMALAHYEEEIKAGRLDPKIDDMPHYAGRLPLTPPTAGQALAIARDFHPMTSLEAKVQADLDVVFGGAMSSLDLPDAAFERIEPKLGNTRIGRDGQIERYVKWGEAPTATEIALRESPGGTAITAIAKGDLCEWNVGERTLARVPKPFTVYLCGPITGDPIDLAWRMDAARILQGYGIVCLNPMRGKDTALISRQGLGYDGQLASTEMAQRDRLDIEEADLIFANFPYDPPRQSIGSLMEMGGAAIGMKKPVVLHAVPAVFRDHLFCRKFCAIMPSFAEALNKIVEIKTHAENQHNASRR